MAEKAKEKKDDAVPDDAKAKKAPIWKKTTVTSRIVNSRDAI